MNRCRWLRADWPTSPRKLAKLLSTRSFTSKSDSGFIVDRVRDTYLEAKYVERIEFTERIMDPFGAEYLIKRLEYRQSSFRAASDMPGLEIYDPPRASRLLAELQEVCDFDLVIANLNIDVLKWAAQLSKALPTKASVCTVQVGELAVASGVTAKVLVSGTGDVRSATDKLIAGKRAVTEKVHVRFAVNHSPLQLSRTGSAKFSSEQGDELLPILRSTLSAQLHQ